MANNSLMQKLMKKTKGLEGAGILENKRGKIGQALFTTDIPILNLALSGDLHGGMDAGATMLVGDSRTFKTCYCLKLAQCYLNTYDDAVMIFLDSEGGASFEYFDQYGIDASRVIHVPIKDVEDLKARAMAFIDDIELGEHVFIFIDSLGMLPSRKEVNDALDDKSVADMTRAKAFNSFWRLVTIPINQKQIPLVAINHYYTTMEMYGKNIIKGGKNNELACNNIWIISKSKIKDGKELTGNTFKINVHKSRRIQEGTLLPIEVMYDNGIQRYSGLLELSRAVGWIVTPTQGWYSRKKYDELGDGEYKKWRKNQLDSEFWETLLADEDYCNDIASMVKLNASSNNEANNALKEMFEDVDEEGNSIVVDPKTGEILND